MVHEVYGDAVSAHDSNSAEAVLIRVKAMVSPYPDGSEERKGVLDAFVSEGRIQSYSTTASTTTVKIHGTDYEV